MKQLSIIIPAYNEETGIDNVISNIKKTMKSTEYKYEIIVVDDGSKDKTAMIAKKNKTKLIQHPENRGYGAALKTGIKNSKNDLILMIDADGTYPVEQIPRLLKFTDEYDMVVGARTGKRVKVPLLRKPAKFFISKLANFLSGKKIPDLNSGLRVFKKEVALRFFNILPSKFSFTTTITLACLSNDYTVKFVSIDYHKRKGKSTIRPIHDTVGFMALIIKTVVYFNPLKVFIPMSIIFFLLAIFIFFYSIFALNRLADISVIITLVSAVQIAFFGLLADIISKKR